MSVEKEILTWPDLGEESRDLALMVHKDGFEPNIILAMADDLGWGDVGYNGSPIIKTPNLDAMSQAGLRFDRFYVPTVCSPTRASTSPRRACSSPTTSLIPATRWPSSRTSASARTARCAARSSTRSRDRS